MYEVHTYIYIYGIYTYEVSEKFNMGCDMTVIIQHENTLHVGGYISKWLVKLCLV